jgi:hypothetical protein
VYANQQQDEQPSQSLAELSIADVSAGLKQALQIGAENVAAQMGTDGGFNLDQSIHIPLSDQIQQAKSWLDKVGMGGSLAELELKLNQAAEESMVAAKPIFADAISAMSIEDARSILSGPDDSATQYLKTKMSPPLTAAMRPCGL